MEVYHKTPITEEGLKQYDDVAEADLAVAKAWILPGPNAKVHEEAKEVVKDVMPVLARNLDRLANHIAKNLKEIEEGEAPFDAYGRRELSFPVSDKMYEKYTDFLVRSGMVDVFALTRALNTYIELKNIKDNGGVIEYTDIQGDTYSLRIR